SVPSPRPLYGITPRPEWLKVRVHDNATSRGIAKLIEDKHLNTVCQEARCPNIFECWGVEKTATFMLMGDVCTRHCGFCAVTQGAGKPLDPEEPRHVAEAVRTLGLAHAVVTSVNRDELPDGGAAHFAATIREIRAMTPGVTIEVLIPDFLGSEAALGAVLAERPEVLNHNAETVPRLYRRVRPDAVYARSLELLRRAAKRRDEEKIPLKVKSGVMVGLGETREELRATLLDLRSCGVDVVTVGQYLQAHARRLPIERYYTPAEFEEIRMEGEEMGFALVESGPLVRSSYHARRALAAGVGLQSS
ncbi:MAG TPA: lipoyl synthase, partial [Thermoanaerobaculia bacterium]|nr:lipoyl synthase [Thermoanaerobaculia bacterium]